MEELEQLRRSLDMLYRAVESIDDIYAQQAAASQLAAIVDGLRSSAAPVPNPPTTYVPPRCPHCNKTVKVTWS